MTSSIWFGGAFDDPGKGSRLKRLVAFAGFSLAMSSTTIAMGAGAAPLPNPNGTVVAWNAQNKTTVIATTDRRVYVLHGLRKSSPGTRIRVQGIKWGTPTKGIKWGKRPQGIKWGIKWARNGTFQARVTRTGKARTMSLRARVVGRVGKKGVVLSVPGATIGLPAARRAVWIPRTTKRSKALSGPFGASVIVNMRVDDKGRVEMTSAQEVPTPPAQSTLPIAGTVVAINRTAGTMRVRVGSNGYTTMLTLKVPTGTDTTKLRVGDSITSSVQEGNPNRPLDVTELAPNDSFAVADAPIVVPKTSGSTPSRTSPAGGPAAADEVAPGPAANPDGPPAADPPPDNGTDPANAPARLQPAAYRLSDIRITWSATVNSPYFPEPAQATIWLAGQVEMEAAARAINLGDLAAAREHLATARVTIEEFRATWNYTTLPPALWIQAAAARNWSLGVRITIDALDTELVALGG